MRAIFLQLLLFAITISVYATDIQTKPDTVYLQLRDDDGEWEYDSRKCYTYYNDGRVKEMETAVWSNYYKGWAHQYKYVFILSDSPKIDRTERYSWDKTNLVWKLSYVNSLEYDSDGNLVLDLDESRGYKTEYEYENGLKVSKTKFRTKDLEGEWDTISNEYWKYDEKGNLLESLKSDSYKEVYAYEADKLVKHQRFIGDNLLIFEKVYVYSNDSVYVSVTEGDEYELLNSVRIVDEEGKMIKETVFDHGYIYNKDVWEDTVIRYYTYNEAGLLEKRSTEMRNKQSKQWTITGETVISRYEDGSVKTSVTHEFADFYNTLIKTKETRFDAEGTMKYNFYVLMNDTAVMDSTIIEYGEPDYKYYESYNSGFFSEEMVPIHYSFSVMEGEDTYEYYSYNWNEEMDDWSLGYKKSTIFDEHGNIMESFIEYFGSSEQPVKRNEQRFINVYPEPVVTATEIADCGVAVFPSVSSNIITVSFESTDDISKIQIIDWSGQIVDETVVKSDIVPMDIRELKDGKYYMLIHRNDSIISRSFIKKQ